MLLITGATGRVGSAAIERAQHCTRPKTVVGLARNNAHAKQILGSEVTVRIADYEDRASLDAAFVGATQLLFVPSDGAAQDVLRHHTNVIEAAAGAGIERIVLVSIVDVEDTSSFYFAPVYRATERLVRSCGCAWTILRSNLYWDFVVSQWINVARNTGLIDIPAGSGAIAPVTCADVAAAAVASFDQIHEGKIYELTAARTTSFAEIAHMASKSLGLAIDYRPISAAAYARRCQATMEEPWPMAFTSMMSSINEGRFGAVSPDIQMLLRAYEISKEPITRLTTKLRDKH